MKIRNSGLLITGAVVALSLGSIGCDEEKKADAKATAVAPAEVKKADVKDTAAAPAEVKKADVKATAVAAPAADVKKADAKAPAAAKKVDAKAPAAAPADAAAKPAEDKWAFLPDVVMVIGDKKVTKQEFIKELSAMLSKSPFPMDSLNGEMIKNFAVSYANEMLAKTILLQVADKDGIKPSKELAVKEIDETLKALSPAENENFKKALEAQKLTIEAYKLKLCDDVNFQEFAAIKAWIRKDIYPKYTITDKDVKDYYDKNAETFKVPETITASHILIMPEKKAGEQKASPEAMAAAKKKAEEILAKINAGESFEDLATKESACPSKAKKGSLGTFARGQMVKEFEDAAFALEPGKISVVVETPFGFHIIKVTEKKAGSVIPFEDKKNEIKQTLLEEKANKDVEATIEAEKTKLGAKINIQ